MVRDRIFWDAVLGWYNGTWVTQQLFENFFPIEDLPVDWPHLGAFVCRLHGTAVLEARLRRGGDGLCDPVAQILLSVSFAI